MSRGTRAATQRGQSSVVGVAVLLGITVVSLGVLTAGVGTLVDGHVARADADRVATDLQGALDPVETTGHSRGTVRFSAGTLRTADRDLRVFDSSGLVAEVSVGALVYEHGERRAASVAGAVVRGRPGNAWFVEPPPVVGTAADDALIVGAARLNASDAAAGGDRASVTLATNVSHDRARLGTGTYSVAIETATPGPFERAFEDRGATVTRRDIDGDGTPSVVARFPGTRTAYLVEHDMRLEVGDG
jgi:flagellin-like protein